jgi:nucleotide-binding universal stress UspA family protein
MVFKKIGLALAFSPTAQAMLAEAHRLARQLDGQLILIHVGPHGATEETQLAALLQATGIPGEQVRTVWEAGEPTKAILRVCKNEGLDLLITGALKKEKLVQYYLGTIARKLLRKAPCSVLTLVNPRPFKNIVVDAEDSPYMVQALTVACHFGQKEKAAWVHIARDLKMYGLTMAASDQCSEEEYDQTRHQLVRDEIEKVERLLGHIAHQGLKINIKITSGKAGFELAKFAQRKNADLLVVAAPPRKFSFLDRVFPHDLEYILADLPCNLLVVHPPASKSSP